MTTKHIIIPSQAIVGAVFVGRAWGRYETNLQAVAASESIPKNLKEEFREMTMEDFEHTTTAIKTIPERLIRSDDDISDRSIPKGDGNEDVDRYITETKERFLAGYHDGSSNYGEWKSLADKIALRFLEEKNGAQPSAKRTIMAVTDRAPSSTLRASHSRL